MSYSEMCGPAVVASVLGIGRADAADRLRAAMIEQGAKRVAKSTTDEALQAVLESSTERPLVAKLQRFEGKDRPTLRRWSTAHQVGEYVTLAADHAVYWRNGIVVEANGVPMAWRGLVISVLEITDPEPETPTEVPDFEPGTTVSIGSGDCTGVVDRQDGMHVWVVDIIDSKGRIARPPGWLRADSLEPMP